MKKFKVSRGNFLEAWDNLTKYDLEIILEGTPVEEDSNIEKFCKHILEEEKEESVEELAQKLANMGYFIPASLIEKKPRFTFPEVKRLTGIDLDKFTDHKNCSDLDLLLAKHINTIEEWINSHDCHE